MSVDVCLFALLIYSQPWKKNSVFLYSPSTVDFLLLSERCHHSSKASAHRFLTYEIIYVSIKSLERYLLKIVLHNEREMKAGKNYDDIKY